MGWSISRRLLLTVGVHCSQTKTKRADEKLASSERGGISSTVKLTSANNFQIMFGFHRGRQHLARCALQKRTDGVDVWALRFKMTHEHSSDAGRRIESHLAEIEARQEECQDRPLSRRAVMGLWLTSASDTL